MRQNYPPLPEVEEVHPVDLTTPEAKAAIKAAAREQLIELGVITS